MITEYRDLFQLLLILAVLAAGAMTWDHLYGPKDD